MEDSRQVVNNPSSVGHTSNKLLPISRVIIHMMLMCEFVFQTCFLQIGFATLTTFVMIMGFGYYQERIVARILEALLPHLEASAANHASINDWTAATISRTDSLLASSYVSVVVVGYRLRQLIRTF